MTERKAAQVLCLILVEQVGDTEQPGYTGMKERLADCRGERRKGATNEIVKLATVLGCG